MSGGKPVPDPYRILGVGRDAGDDEVKAAHRRLAKRHHPDAGGQEARFLAVQDAYQLLADPARRRDWDRRHAPGPVRARDRTGRARSRTASSPWTREDTSAFKPGRGRRSGRERYGSGDGVGRDPRRRHHTWSAAGVPWWEDFVPRGSSRDAGADETSPGTGRPERADDPASAADSSPSPEPRRQPDFDVYDRSSGAAWSMAARRHFRKGDADLPSRGAFRYRGTQVVTGAEARKVAAEEAAAARPRAPRSAPRPAAAPEPPQRGAQRTPSRPTPPPPAAAPTAPTRATSRHAPPSRSHPDEPASSSPRRTTTTDDAPPVKPPERDRPAHQAEPAATPASAAIDAETPASDGAATLGADHPQRESSGPGRATSATLTGAVVGPVSVLAGAGLSGGLDGSPGATLLLMLGAAAIAGGAIGRGLAHRRST